jgi:LacI family transcriptional regulator
MAQRPTIKDVARKANVSLSTVSLVLNNKGYVSQRTKERVERVIHELGYHPTSSARGLALRRSGNIGFILTNDHFTQSEPFYTKVFLGAEFEAQRHNFYILLTTVGRKFNPQKSVPRFLIEGNVDGVIIAGRIDKRLIEYINSMNLPLVLIDYEVNNSIYSTILINNYKGAQRAVRHLIDEGHRMVGFIGGDIKHPSIAHRFEGYKEALASNGIELRQAWVETGQPDTRFEDGYNAAARLYSTPGRKPTAVFAVNDAMALGALKYFNEMGVAVPGEIAIVGFDNIEASYRSKPSLTTIDVHKEEMGVMAVRTLVNILKEGNGVVRQIHTSVELIVRESSLHNLPITIPE